MNKRNGFIALLVIGLVALLGYRYLYQEHRDVAATTPVARYNSQELLALFKDGDPHNDEQALDQVILLSGTITQITATSIIIDGSVFISIADVSNFEVGQPVTLKGRCLGYDELLEEIKIDQAILNL
jgi:hypothetical protein